MTVTTTLPARTYVEPGQHVSIRLPWSEVCMHMRVAETVMDVELTEGPYPMAQLWKDGHRFSFPVTTGEAGFYQDARGYYTYADGQS